MNIFLWKWNRNHGKNLEFRAIRQILIENEIHKAIFIKKILRMPKVLMDLCVVHGNFFQNYLHGFAHILRGEFLTMNYHNKCTN